MDAELEGATSAGASEVYPANAGEFAATFNATSRERRDAFVAQMVASSESAGQCVVLDHVGEIAHLTAQRDALADEVRMLRRQEAARVRDAASPEFVPESVMDAAFRSQEHWWVPGDDARKPVIQLVGPQPRPSLVVVASLIESVAEATYRATIAEIGGGAG